MLKNVTSVQQHRSHLGEPNYLEQLLQKDLLFCFAVRVVLCFNFKYGVGIEIWEFEVCAYFNLINRNCDLVILVQKLHKIITTAAMEDSTVTNSKCVYWPFQMTAILFFQQTTFSLYSQIVTYLHLNEDIFDSGNWILSYSEYPIVTLN